MKKLLFIFLFLLYTFSNIHAYEKKHLISFNPSEITFTKIKNYDVITLKNLGVTYVAGEPQLPLHVIHLIIPGCTNVSDVQIINTKSDTLYGNYLLYPVQQPVILSKSNEEIKFTEPKSEIYSSPSPYPHKIIKFAGNGYSGDTNIASFFIYPIQYLPARQKIIFHSFIQFKISTYPNNNKSLITLNNPTETQKQFHNQMVSNLVSNSEDIKKFCGLSMTSSISEEYQYLIITNSSLVNNFKPLADWKTQKGVPTRIITTEIIKNSYPGIDDAEKVRECIKEYYKNHGTIWVLLGGDTELVPYRTAFAMTCDNDYNPWQDDIPCDLYFADLDGNWDYNNNGLYGEVTDSVDLFPEVFVGRASVETTEEVDAFVTKILAYEKPLAADYQSNILFAAEILWIDPYTDAGVGKDMIEKETLPLDVFNITKLYQSNGNESESSVISELNAGQNIFNHDGHAWYSLMSVGNGSLTHSSMENLRNHPKYGIIFSIGCWPAAFDYDCVAEAFLTNPQGGGVAFIGNSKYGWGSPGNPGYGYSDRYDHRFYHVLFHDKISNIGATLALAKTHFIPYSKQENVYRFCMYQVNLLGDPEMPIWTNNPETLSVIHPDSVASGSSVISLQVTDNGSPVTDATVCIMQKTDIYQYGTTDHSGEINFSITTSNVNDPILVTVTANNYQRWEGFINVVSNAAYVKHSNVTIDDSEGNNDGFINPGERVNLFLTFKNYGNQSVSKLDAYLISQDSSIVIEDSLIQIDDLGAGDSVTCSDSFRLTTSQNCSNGDVCYLALQIRPVTGDGWDDILTISIATPVISFADLQVNDHNDGNGNGLADPCENFELYLYLKNNGLAPANNVIATMMCDDPYLILPSKTGMFGDLLPQATAIDSFDIIIADSCPQVHFPVVMLDISTDNGYSFNNRFTLSIGSLGFEDDMEQGWGQWELLPLPNNEWHLTTYRAHSQSHSWYCGDEQSRKYKAAKQSILVTPYFYLGPESQLSFWTWYDVPVYRQPGYSGDGFYVEILGDSYRKTLDWIGSGGDLNFTLMGHDWAEYTYDLSDVPIGVPIRVKFKSDPAEELEGVYIDDIRIESKLVTSSVDDWLRTSSIPKQFYLEQNYPNPFNSITKISFQIAGDISYHVSLDIFNTMGQKVKTLINKQMKAGNYVVNWNGLSDSNQRVTTGIYLYQMKVNNFKTTRKLLFLR